MLFPSAYPLSLRILILAGEALALILGLAALWLATAFAFALLAEG